MAKIRLGKEYVFALAGNPNSGKTTLFNELTGSNYEVGNFAGVTVERKEGICKYVFHDHITHFDTHDHAQEHRQDEAHSHIKIVDLPGIYSLAPNSAEEVITRDYILKEKPDLILNIVDATNLERNLYLTTQLAEMETPMVIALNMMDALESNGCSIDVDELQNRLGIRVMPISASKGRGVQDLVTEALNIASKHIVHPHPVHYKNKIEDAIEKIRVSEEVPRLCAVKLIENDERLTKDIKSNATRETMEAVSEEFPDMETVIASKRYSFIKKTVNACVKRIGPNRQAQRTHKIDSVVCHPLFAIPLFLLIIFAIFEITFGPFGSMLSDWVDWLFNDKFASIVESGLNAMGVHDFVKRLVVEGVISGVGGVVTFFPQIMLLFFVFILP